MHLGSITEENATGGQKANHRFLKYSNKGYKDPFVTSNDVNRMIFEVGDYPDYICNTYNDEQMQEHQDCMCTFIEL